MGVKRICWHEHRCRALLRIAYTLAVLCVCSSAVAGDKATAESMFQQGKRAMGAGDYDKACPLLEASLKEERAVGTLLNLALCHRQQGQTATAWAEFREAAGMAERAGQPERAEGAAQYAAELERSLSTITVSVDRLVDGLVVTRDDKTIAPAAYGVPIAADPGPHTVVATAPGRERWSETVQLGARADRKNVTVPELRPLGSHDESLSGDRASEGPSADPVLVTGLVVGGIGLVTLGVGVVLGAVAVSDRDKLDAQCPGRVNCSDDVLSQRDTVAAKADAATGTIIGGSAALAAGLLMVLLAPSDDEDAQDRASLRIEPHLGLSYRGLGIAGSF